MAGLQINEERSKFMIINQQNAGQTRRNKTANRSFKNAEMFKNLRKKFTVID